MKSFNNSVFVPAALTAVLMALLFGGPALANIIGSHPVTTERYQTYTFFATSTSQTNYGTTTTATSTNIDSWTDSNGRIDNGYFVIAGAKRVTFAFQRDAGTAGNNGSTTPRVQATTVVFPSETDWFYVGDLVSATTTNTYTDSAISIVGTTTARVSLDVSDKAFWAVRCIVQEVIDGEHECSAVADF